MKSCQPFSSGAPYNHRRPYRFPPLVIAGALFCVWSPDAMAQALASPGDNQAMREQQRQDEARRSLTPNAPDAFGGGIRGADASPTSAESPCFEIRLITLNEPDGIAPGTYAWALEGTGAFRGRCLGEKGLNALLAQVQNALVGRGLVTTRAVAGAQNLKSGTFAITIVEGRLASVQPGKETPPDFPWKSGLGARAGDLVDQRGLEQALEVFKSLPTAEASFQLVPGSKPGESNLVIDWKQPKIWRLSAQVDDSGSKATGKLIGTGTGYLENAAGFNELLYASYDQDLQAREGSKGLRGGAMHLSIPYTFSLLSLDASTSRYHQSVAGAFQTYDYSGRTSNATAVLSTIVHRDSTSKTTIAAGLWAKSMNNYIDVTEIDVQRRRTAGFMLEARHKQYIGKSSFELTVTTTRAQAWFGALPAPEDQFNEGVSRPNLLKAELVSTIPFIIGGFDFTFENVSRAQWTRQPLVVTDRFSIGGRYTVRGFDGESTLAGEKGFVTRNTFSLALGETGQIFYLGLDHGAVFGPSTQWLSGNRLTGAVAGMKGRWRFFEYDVFAGTALAAPPGFDAPSVTVGFMAKAMW